MYKKQKFTLIELLTVVGIIIILAGILIPTVTIARERARITQAKADIASLRTALKQMQADYHKMLALYGGSSYRIGGQTITASSNIATIDGDAYDAMIAELSAPKNSGLTVNVNKRKRTYIEPKKGFDPTAAYTATANQPSLWRDPWGNPYVIYIKVTQDGELAVPGTGKTIAGDVAIYSFGPNETDDSGCTVDLDSCICSDSDKRDEHKQHDDVASWEL